MRLSISGSLVDGKKVPINVVLKTYYNRLKQLWRDSVKAFIFTVVDRVSIDTGMSLASLQPLAARVRMRTIIMETLRGRGPRKGYTDLSGTYHGNQYKSRAHGERLGKKAYKLTFGTPRDLDLQFTFDIVVYQYKFHEPTWASLEAGKLAFIEYFESNFKRVIRVDDLVGQLVTGS